MKNVLLLGATGRIGGIVLKNLLPDKAKVRAYVRKPEKPDPELAGQVEVIKGDILDSESLARAMEGMDTVAPWQGSSPIWWRMRCLA